MARAAFWHGLLLWQHLQYPRLAVAVSGGGEGVGIDRPWGASVTSSPNARREVVVRTVIDTVPAVSPLSDEATMELLLAQIGDALVALAVAKGPLSYCDDPDRKADVTGGPYAAGVQVVSHGTPGAGWTPTATRYLLCRNPATGAGFVSAISAVGAGTVTITVPVGVSVTTAWDLVDVAFHYPDARFVGFDPGDPTVPLGDTLRMEATYSFVNESAAVALESVPRGNA